MFAAVEGKRFASVRLAAGAACVALLIAGCGGARQDASEPSGTYHVSIVSASFPKLQSVAATTRMVVTVRNDDTKTVPNLAITVTTNSAGGPVGSGTQGAAANGFNYVSTQPGLSNPQRPVWIVDDVIIDDTTHNGITAQNATWAVGPLAPGATRTFSWQLTPVKPGTWSVGYRVDAGLNGKALAALANGQPPTGALRARIGAIPPQSRVDPNTGRVVRKPPSVAPGTPPQAAGEGQ
jgi:hypothetical protein